MKEIRDHALLYALLAKYCIEVCDKEEGERLIEKITVLYGHRRGKRMRSLSDQDGLIPDINAYLTHGEWRGKPGENISTLKLTDDRTVSSVSKCAWYDTWKKYDLVSYGSYYCRYIDQALCEGFDGTFGLEIPGTLSGGNDVCLFEWSQSADLMKVDALRKEYGDQYIRSFDYHTDELLACAAEILNAENRRSVLELAKQEYEKLMKSSTAISDSY